MILVIATGLAAGCVYAIVAIGYSLVYATTGIVNFSQGAYVAVGGLMTYWFKQVLGLSYPAAISCGVLSAVLSGLVLWVLVIAPMWRRQAPHFAVLLATIAYGGALSGALEAAFGTDPQLVPVWARGFTIRLGGAFIDGQYVIIAAATAVICLTVAAILRFTVAGISMRACAANRATATLFGISPGRVGLLAIASTAGLGGLAGAMVAPVAFASYSDGPTYGLLGITAAVLGGFGSLGGSVVGGLVLGLVYAVVGRYGSASYEDVIAFALLFLMLVARPRGLLNVGTLRLHE